LSCKKAGPAPNSAANKPTPVDTSATGTKHDTLITDVYIAGDLGGRAQLWKNGVGTALSNVGGSTGMHVVVLNGNTYVCGTEQGVAVYWKNFEMSTRLTDGNEMTSIANDIALQGNDLLCVGTVRYKTGLKAILWRNRQMTVIDSNDAAATRILVKGNDIYITGSRLNANRKPVACYWKNGIAHDLSVPTQQATASGIAIDNNSNIYVCGTLDPSLSNTPPRSVPVYWKNDVMTMLPKTRKGSWANAISINGDDVYIVGSGEDDPFWGYNEAYYWKNGIQQYFPGGSCVNDISMIGNNIFITGTKYSDQKPYGRLWENTSTLYLQPSLTITYLEPYTASNFTGLYINQYYK
jgi:uncharacterized membrane protein